MPATQAQHNAIKTQYAEIIAVLKTLASIEPSACDCGRTTEHMRCSRCGECEPNKDTSTSSCQLCGAKSSYYRQPLRRWQPRTPFAASFAHELLAKVERGWAPSDKQIALARKLFAEQTAPKPSFADKPAINWVTLRSPAWKALVTLVSREVELTTSTVYAIDDVQLGILAGDESKQAAREALEIVRAAAKRIISEATGYDVLTTPEEYADAMRAVAPSGRGKKARGDKALYAALAALLDTHSWLSKRGLAA